MKPSRFSSSPHLDNYDLSWVDGVDLGEGGFGVGLDEDESQARGSNNWVVSGARTRTGKPILCNDPHLTVFCWGTLALPDAIWR